MLNADSRWGDRQQAAWRDLGEAVALRRLIFKLGMLDIRLRYRGSMIGPFWVTLSTAIMVAALGLLYSRLFHMNLHQYLPFLAISIILWNSLSGMVTESCNVFIESESMIRSVRMPFSVHVGRVIVRNQVALAHNLIVIVGVFAILSVWPNRLGLLAIPGYALWLIDAVGTCLLLGSFCARFRDIPPIVASVLQIAFFVSPIIWKPESLGTEQKWLVLNPFYTLLEVVRGPLLGEPASTAIWGSALFYSAVLCGGAWLLFSRVRGRLAFWV
jgi:lipopolysaccharide transport system permease protein